MASEEGRTSEDAWLSVVAELALWPRSLTVEMRRQHPRGSNGRCTGPHGPAAVTWPCSTRRLADAVDRQRRRQREVVIPEQRQTSGRPLVPLPCPAPAR